MSHSSYDPTQPRNKGKFDVKPDRKPEGALAAGPVDPAIEAQRAVEAVTHGRLQLEAAIGKGQFTYSTLADTQQLVWEGAGGTPHLYSAAHTFPYFGQLDAEKVEKSLETVFHRARSGRYRHDEGKDSVLVPVDADALLAADRDAERRTEHAAEMMDGGHGALLGADAEIPEDSARLFAEATLQEHLPDGLSITEFPRLAEFANQPYSVAAGSPSEKVDELHAELGAIYKDNGGIGPRQRRRIDMLFTYSLHALPGQP